MVFYEVLVTALAFLAVALLILLFERRRARGIEHDLREMAAQRRTVKRVQRPGA